MDYEPLLARAASLTLTGDRAYDLALRMRYVGRRRPTGLQVLPDPEAALDAAVAATPVGGTLYVAAHLHGDAGPAGDAGAARRRGGLLA